MKPIYLTACVALALCGCNSNQRAAERAVRDMLKDPDSAKFGEFYFNEETNAGCLTVNAKNSMGGYTGDQQAFVVKDEKGFETLRINEFGPDICKKFADDWKIEGDSSSPE